MAWRKLTGQSGKRVVTLNIAANSNSSTNTSASANANVGVGTASSDKEKEREKEALSPTAVTASIGSDNTILTVAAPSAALSLQVIV